ncbi:tRNA preQ1(34) S-adenosylmethionine ribosyltransferase-isomerase QueA [bacterium]|nr:tRNA preQ1(34) S-adenosylmethionine ribosyltransferase-isomerase QueA [bacterium]
MHLSEFDYPLPQALIAQEPLAQRDNSRLLVVNRQDQTIEHRKFFEILEYLRDDDLIVFNDTRVTAARLYGHKETGGHVEALLMKHTGQGLWEAMVKPGRRVGVGSTILFDGGLSAFVKDRDDQGIRTLKFSAAVDPDMLIKAAGQVPLPPYIHKQLNDPERYQTVYAHAGGSAAAPTAGLHFTPEILNKIAERGIQKVFVTLNVGIGTFRPVRVDNIDDHEMHTEEFEITESAADAINSAQGRIVCVGTTTARCLESAAVSKRRVRPGGGATNLFIKPGYEFKIVEALVTNFHIPKSTLLVLVSAFAGIDTIKRAYEEALRERYRFLSFGDAMFLC